MKNRLLIFLIASLVFLAANGLKYLLEGDEGKIKRVVYAGKALMEKKKALGLTGLISIDYYDDFSNDRRMLLLIARDFFDSCENILIKIDKMSIKAEDKNAVADIDATAYWKENGSKDILYDVYKVKASFRKEDGGWKLIKLEFLKPENINILSPRVS
ncbi:MAG: hypothetical protein Q8R48_07125 [Candidatus Omnitrophota bacterium]|nr:hypothetical protein [Candidatus Omnitrophota bacterium]